MDLHPLCFILALRAFIYPARTQYLPSRAYGLSIRAYAGGINVFQSMCHVVEDANTLSWMEHVLPISDFLSFASCLLLQAQNG